MSKPLIVNKDNIQAPVGTIEDFKRPNHRDFMTASELKAEKFSGLRSNSITQDSEFWIEGECVKSVSPLELQRNPHAITDAMEEFFQTGKELRPDIPALRKHKGDL